MASDGPSLSWADLLETVTAIIGGYIYVCMYVLVPILIQLLLLLYRAIPMSILLLYCCMCSSAIISIMKSTEVQNPRHAIAEITHRTFLKFLPKNGGVAHTHAQTQDSRPPLYAAILCL